MMGWMVRHCAWVVNNFQVKCTGRTPYRSIRGKDYTGEVMPFGEICLSRNHSEDGAKLNMRWMRGFFVGKLDRTDEFLLLTPTGAMKTRCVRRLEGDNAWNLQFLNLCVGSPWNATARSTQQTPTIQQKDELDSGRRAKRVYLRQNILDKYGRTAAQVVLELGSTQRSAEQELNKKWWTRVMQFKLKEPDANLKKRKIGEPDINPGGASSLTADTPKRKESEQGSSANESSLAGCIAAVNNILCDVPTVDLSRDRTALRVAKHVKF